jgi:hypothetical protein
MWEGGKDNHVCVHTRNILWGWGCFRYVKVPSFPYKSGRKGTCKRIQTFLGLVLLTGGVSVSLRPNCAVERVLNFHLCLGSIPNFSGTPNMDYGCLMLLLEHREKASSLLWPMGRLVQCCSSVWLHILVCVNKTCDCMMDLYSLYLVDL